MKLKILSLFKGVRIYKFAKRSRSGYILITQEQGRIHYNTVAKLIEIIYKRFYKEKEKRKKTFYFHVFSRRMTDVPTTDQINFFILIREENSCYLF